ncbi:MAG: hypothetical protein M3R43_07595, partial [Acidobacteriota bacterium]|nr:hypothetical protein [Acidobacteriota bacterium]
MGKTIDQVMPVHSFSPRLSLSGRLRHGRAVNAVADYLRSRLRVPNVYIEASIPTLNKIDVLAADSAGSGDIHAVEVKFPIDIGFAFSPASKLKAYLDELKDEFKKVPAHFKYLALPVNGKSLAALGDPQMFSHDGIGRIGILFISEVGDTSPTVELVITPE